LETLMLGKWEMSPFRVPSEEECQSAGTACIVVLPTFISYLLEIDGNRWDALTGQSKHSSDYTTGYTKYWTALREKWFQPAAGIMPLIVLHSSFANARRRSAIMLNTLAKQPKEFQDRVVLANIDSITENGNLPAGWIDQAHDRLWLRERRDPCDEASQGPLLISLPYPSSVTQTGAFSAMQQTRARRINVLLSVSFKRLSPIRNKLIDDIQRRHDLAQPQHGHAHFLCAGGISTDHCGVPENQRHIWGLAVSSVFCIEPSGDTLSRSHLYVAVQTGCIPVIFNGGHKHFNGSVWAWQATRSPAIKPFLNYEEFTITFDAEDVLSGKVDVYDRLLDMQRNDPSRIRSIQKKLDEIAPMMTYSMRSPTKECLARDDLFNGCHDAFTLFHMLMDKEARRPICNHI